VLYFEKKINRLEKLFLTKKKLRFKNEKSIDYLKIPIEDDNEEPIENFLEQTCNFIGKIIN
jgi:hypothetical protein